MNDVGKEKNSLCEGSETKLGMMIWRIGLSTERTGLWNGQAIMLRGPGHAVPLSTTIKK